MTRKDQAEKAFELALKSHSYQIQQRFLSEMDSSYLREPSFTEEELKVKGEKLKELMDEGSSFGEAIDHPSVYVGSLDGEFLFQTYVKKDNSKSYQEWMDEQFIIQANIFFRKLK